MPGHASMGGITRKALSHRLETIHKWNNKMLGLFPLILKTLSRTPASTPVLSTFSYFSNIPFNIKYIIEHSVQVNYLIIYE